MKRYNSRWSSLGAGAVAAVALMVTANAQNPPGGPGGPGGAGNPRMARPVAETPPATAPAKLRAFTGNWTNENVTPGVTKPGIVPFKPEYAKKVEELAKLAVAGDEVPGNEPKCIPNGPIMDGEFGLQVFADAQQMVVLSTGPRVRLVWVDGRKHTVDDLIFPSYSGESVAHWEGDTLVIDTVGLQPTNEIVFGVAANDNNVHLIERWRLLTPSTLLVETTVEDSAVLTRPWTYSRSYTRRPANGEVVYCVSEFDRSRDGGFDLTPPSGGYIPPGTEPGGKEAGK